MHCFVSIIAIIAIIGISPAFGQIQNSITVTTDKVYYSDGETILVTGQVRDLYSGTPVSVIVTSPCDCNEDGEYDLISIAQVKVGTDKKFSTEITAGGTLMKASGTYTITAQYGTENRSDTTTFEFGGSTIVPPQSKANFSGLESIVKNMYVDNDTISIIFSMNVKKSGSFTTDIPRNVLDATINGRDIDFIVLVDGENTRYDEIKSPIYRKLTIPYTSGTEEIEIIGTKLNNNETIHTENDSLCGPGTYYDYPTNSCKLDTPYPNINEENNLQKENTQLKIENKQLKNQINTLQEKLDNLQNIINEQIKVIMNTLQELKTK